VPKPRKPGDIPPPLELHCLRVLWDLKEGSVKDVRTAIAGSRQLAYTTVMTVLDRLVKKGGLGRRKIGRSFVYAPLLSREALRKLAVKDVVESFFEGSYEDLMAYLREGAHAQPVFPSYHEDDDRLDPSLL
jgi:predicted transcriptional regulator